MRIIKADNEQKTAVITTLDFPELEGLSLGDPMDDDFDGGDTAEAPAAMQSMSEERMSLVEQEIEKARMEGDRIVEQASQEADEIRDRARAEAEQMNNAALQEADQIRQAAVKDGEQLKREAYSQGYSAGEENGYKEGYQSGYGKGKAAATEECKNGTLMLNKVIDDLKNYRIEILNEAQGDIIKMALTVAERILHKEIMTDPRSVVSVVKNAIGKVSFKKQFVVHVNPLDIDVLQQSSAEIAALLDSVDSLKFRPNPKIEPGGCVIQTESGSVDAQVDRQFAELKDQVLAAVDLNETAE